MPVRRLQEYLDKQHVPYTTQRHEPAYTTSEVAELAHVPGQEIAKTVMVKLDGTLAMAVLPGCCRVDLERLGALAGATVIELATECEFRDRFPYCAIGAMPPFGNLYGVPVFVAARLALDEEIVFNAGTHAELMRLRFTDFDRLVRPIIGRFAVPL
ncbi:MAG: YbaK/EbsC family protein [Candidatus Eisenbacteria bacterium]